jgi:hypothetical protein
VPPALGDGAEQVHQDERGAEQVIEKFLSNLSPKKLMSKELNREVS